jgi:hypothetical protein
MHESDTYLAILDEGQEKAFREVIRLQGKQLFGAPDEAIMARLNGITDLDRLKRMVCKTLTAASWQDILDTP